MGTAIQLNESVVWGFAVEVSCGVRLRLSVDDWECLNLNPAPRIRVGLQNRLDALLIVADLVEVPPVVWITLTHRVSGRAIDTGDRLGSCQGADHRSWLGNLEAFECSDERFRQKLPSNYRESSRPGAAGPAAQKGGSGVWSGLLFKRWLAGFRQLTRSEK